MDPLGVSNEVIARLGADAAARDRVAEVCISEADATAFLGEGSLLPDPRLINDPAAARGSRVLSIGCRSLSLSSPRRRREPAPSRVAPRREPSRSRAAGRRLPASCPASRAAAFPRRPASRAGAFPRRPASRAAADRSLLLPSTTMHASARGLAAIYGALGNAGALGSKRALSPDDAAGLVEDVAASRAVQPLGFRRYRVNGADGAPRTAFGHAGLAQLHAFCDPSAKAGVAVVFNQLSPASDVARDVLGALYEDLGLGAVELDRS